MFCRNCGTEIPDNALFCVKCGTPTGTDQINSYIASPAPLVKKRKGLKVIIICAVIACVVIAGIMITKSLHFTARDFQTFMKWQGFSVSNVGQEMDSNFNIYFSCGASKDNIGDILFSEYSTAEEAYYSYNYYSSFSTHYLSLGHKVVDKDYVVMLQYDLDDDSPFRGEILTKNAYIKFWAKDADSLAYITQVLRNGGYLKTSYSVNDLDGKTENYYLR